MIETMIALVALSMGAFLTYLAKEVDPLFGWALVGIYGMMLILGGIVLLKGDK